MVDEDVADRAACKRWMEGVVDGTTCRMHIEDMADRAACRR